MRPAAGSRAILFALIGKELVLYRRNTLYLFLSALTLVLFVALFWVSPDSVEQSLTVGISPPLRVLLEEGRRSLGELGVPPELIDQLEGTSIGDEEGLRLVQLEDAQQLQAIIAGELQLFRTSDGEFRIWDPKGSEARPRGLDRVDLGIGIDFQRDFLAEVATGGSATVRVITDAAVPAEIQHAISSLVREIALAVAGRPLPVTIPDQELIVLGTDRLENPISMRDKLRPLMALMVLVVETYAVASLVSIEVIQRTVTALLVTPMQLWQFLLAKTVVGTALAFGQGTLILLLVAAFTPGNWSLLLTAMLLGGLLFTSVAMLIGAAGKDFMDQLMYAVLFSVPLMIPAFAILFPGTAAAWVRLLPSYPIVDLIVGVTIYDATWADSLGALASGLAWTLALFGLGVLVLRRKVEAL